MQLTKIVLLAMMMLLTACENTPSNNYCDIAKPIYLDKGDELTPDTSREILMYDDQGHALCNWPFTI